MRPNSTLLNDLPVGAHLVSPRWGYLHHGIYAGHGRVIHYAGFNRPLSRGPIEEVSFDRFAQGRAVHRRPWAEPRFSGDAVVERARSRLGESRYRFWTNNCEHLATWCVSGQSRSAQVDAVTTPLRATLGALGAWFPVRRSGQPNPG